MYKFLDTGCSVTAEKVNTEEPSVKKTKLRKFDYSYIKYDVIVTAENSAHCAWKCDPLKHWNSTDMSQQLIANKSKDFVFRERKKNTSSKRYDWLTYHDNTRESTASIVSCSPAYSQMWKASRDRDMCRVMLGEEQNLHCKISFIL